MLRFVETAESFSSSGMVATITFLQKAQTHPQILFYSEPVGSGIQRIGHRIHFHPLETRHFVQAPSLLHQHWWTQSGWFRCGITASLPGQIQTANL